MINRRDFITKSASGAGLLALGGAVAGAVARAGAAEAAPNPFSYDLGNLAKTDPALLRYEQVTRFSAGCREPRRLAIGPGDRVYLAAQGAIRILGREGEPISEIPLRGSARCVAVAADGTVYAGLRDHIEVFDAQGAPLGAWESPGKRTWFTGLALDAENVFAADSGNRVVLRYDQSGRVQGRIGQRNKERGVPGLIVPSPYLDVALGKDGLVRVNNPGRHVVESYTFNGDLELSWGKPSGAIDGFCGCCNPIGLAMLPDGKCVTCEKGLPRVKVHAADGSLDCVVAGPESFAENAQTGSVQDLSDGAMGGLDAAVDSGGRIYILDLVARQVRVMRRKG